jgi:hypothetical protein
MEIYNWLPIYPEFDDDVRLILGKMVNYEKPGYDIYRKKEFNDFKLEKEETLFSNQKLYRHQVIISRFLSNHTHYRGLLLMHEPGTGKTCSAIGTVERLRKEKGGIKGALILAKNEGLIDNFKRDLVKCGTGYYYESNGKLSKNYREFYDFQTIEKFFTHSITKDYNHHVIIIDEIHNYRNTGKNSIYSIIHKFLHKLNYCKILLMTGTPMTDKPEEIADVLNLILPLDRQLPVKDQFISEFLDKVDSAEIEEISENSSVIEEDEETEEEEDSGETKENNIFNPTYVLSDPEKIRKLKNYFHGVVSVLKTAKSTVIRKYIGSLKLDNFTLYGVELSDFQRKSYQIAYQLDKNLIKRSRKKGVYNETKQCMAFVYPDGSYGRKGFEKYFIENRDTNKNTVIQVSTQPYVFRKTLARNEQSLYQALTEPMALCDKCFGNQPRIGCIDCRLKKLSEFSTKYADCIKKILNSPDDNHFVYMEFAKGSGAISFARILEIFGFNDYLYNPNKNNCYILATTQTINNTQLSLALQEYNKPSNLHGKKIRVIVGTSMISESYTLKNIQHIHILVPDWNFGVTDQAIARGIRLKSHDDLIKEKIEKGEDPNITVNIYLYCSTHPDMETTDLFMYRKSQEKDIAIKSVEYVLKQASVDCALNRERNLLPEHLNNQRICEYKECNYSCDGITEEEYDKPLIDHSTYHLYYNEEDTENIMKKIYKLLKRNHRLKLKKIIHQFEKKYTKETVVKAIEIMVERNENVPDCFNHPRFVRYDNDFVYLTYNLSNNSNFFDNYYVEHFPLKEYRNIEDEILNLYYNNIPQFIDALKTENDSKIKKELFNKFSLQLQEMMLESAILARKENISDDLTEYITDQLSAFWKELDDTYVSILIETNYRCLQKNENEWKNCPDDILKQIEEKKEEDAERFTTNEYGYHGIVDKQNEFSLVKNIPKEELRVRADGGVDNRTNSGQVCGTWKIPQLLKAVDAIKLEFIDEFSGKDLENAYEMMTKNSANTAFSFEEFTSFNENDKKRILYWGRKKRGEICDAIQKWLFEHNLINRVAEKTNKKIRKKKGD